jgi:hypothetical protein
MVIRLITGLLLALAAPAARAGDKIDVKVVKYEGLAETVRQARGKVVVIDFWSLY